MRTGQRSPRRQFYGRSRMRALLNSALYSLVWWMFRPFNGLVRYKSAPQPLRETLKIDPTKPVVYILAQRSWVDMFVLARLCREQVLPRPNQIGRAHVGTPVTNARIVCRLMLEKKTTK